MTSGPPSLDFGSSCIRDAFWPATRKAAGDLSCRRGACPAVLGPGESEGARPDRQRGGENVRDETEVLLAASRASTPRRACRRSGVRAQYLLGVR